MKFFKKIIFLLSQPTKAVVSKCARVCQIISLLSFPLIHSCRTEVAVKTFQGGAQASLNTSVEDPTFSIPSGAYGGEQVVALASTTLGATIYYTLDGATPSTNSTAYSSPLVVARTQTIKAIAVKENYTSSNIVSASYVINGPVQTPIANFPGNTFNNNLSVTLSTVPLAANIYYTIDGSDPTTASTKYTGSISITGNTTLKAIAVMNGYLNSGVMSETYALVALPPTANINPGEYGPAQTVTFSSGTAGSTVHYTSDGSAPTCTSATGPVSVTSSTTLKGITCKSNYSSSAVTSFAYIINGAASTPTFSVTTGTYYSPQTVSISTSTPGATIRYTTDGSTPNASSLAYSSSINISANQTIKAIALKANFIDSTVASASYTFNSITPLAIEAFPNTTNYPTITWTPNVKFSLMADDTIGLYSDQLGTAINTPTLATSGNNIFSANLVTTLGQTNTIYAKPPTQQSYVNLGSYSTKIPPSIRIPGISGTVTTIVKDKVTEGCTVAPHCLIVGGGFTYVGNLQVNNILRIKTDGSIAALGNGLNDGVIAVSIDSSGNIYAAGYFYCEGGSTTAGDWPNYTCTGAGGSTVFNRIAKWNGTTWSALGSGFDDSVYALAADNSGNLYAGGIFHCSAGSVATWSVGTGYSCPGAGDTNVYNGIAKWNGTSWTPLSSGISHAVRALTIDSSGNLYAGGTIDTAGGIWVNGIAKWNGSSWSALGNGFHIAFITAITLDGSGNLYVMGFFRCAAGSTSSGTYPNNTCSGSGGSTVYNGIAKWNGSSWLALGSGFDVDSGVVANALALDDTGNVYAAGVFTKAGGIAANKVAMWNGVTWSAVGEGVRGSGSYVLTAAFDGSGNLYTGGSFQSAGASAANNIAKWNGTSWSSAIPGFGVTGAVTTLAYDNTGNLFVGGTFNSTGNIAAGKIAKWNGSNWSTLGFGFNGYFVGALAFDNSGNLYAGGYFECAGGSSSSGIYPSNTCSGTGGSTVFNNIAKWNGSSWSNVGSGFDDYVLSLVSDGSSNLYAGGFFQSAGGISAPNIAKWNGSSWSAVGSGFNDTVQILAKDASGNIFAGGAFTCAYGSSSSGSYPSNSCSGTGGTTVFNGIAKWNGTSWSPLGSGVDGQVNSLAFDSSGNLFVGGSFTTAGGVTANNIAKWNGSTWSALGTGVTGEPGGTSVNKLTFDQAGNLYVGGSYTQAGAVPANSIAKWNGSTWSALGTGLMLYNDQASVSELVFSPAGNLVVGGYFDSAGSMSRPNLAMWITLFDSWF